MKTKVLYFLLASGLLVLAAWFVQVPNSTQAVEFPDKYRETVQKGLDYLVKNQLQDGHWEGDGGQHPVAMTGLVGLALLMERTGPPDPRRQFPAGKYTTSIRKAVDWLMAKSQAGRDGLIFSDHESETSRYMQGHGLATLFLAGALQSESDDVHRGKLAAVLMQAVKYIVKAQSTQGGWYHTSKVEGHDFGVVSATVIQIQALQAAENAGIPVPQEVFNDAQEFLKTALENYQEEAKDGQSPDKLAETAAALACLLPSHRFGGGKDELIKNWIKYCQTKIPIGRDIKFGRDELTHYYYAQAMFNLGADWNNYRTAMFDHLLDTQNKDGSWPAGEGLGVGPVYSTAVWSTIFQLDKQSHPSRPFIPVPIT